MSFLLLNKGKVQCSEQGFTLAEVRHLWGSDRSSPPKSFFNEVITAIFFIYTPRGIFWNKPLSERIALVNKDYLKTSTWEALLAREGVQALVDKYRELTTTVSERLMEGLKQDFVALSKIQENTPMVVSHTLQEVVEIPLEGGAIHKIRVKKQIEIPNMEKKTELYQAYLNMARMIDQINKLLRVEEEEREREDGEKRMFDNRDKYTQTATASV